MKRKIICIFLILLTFLLYGEEDIEEILRRGIRDIEKNIRERIVVSFGNFTYSDKEIGSSFSKYIENQLNLVLTDNEKFEVFAREKLEEILEAIELSLSDLSDPKNAVQVGKLKGFQGIFSGRYFDTAESVTVYLDLISVETGTYIGRTKVSVPKSIIPASISLFPNNYSNALFVLDELSEVENANNQEFIVKAWTLRGNGGTYIDGEELVINFYTNRDCYIKLYHIDVNKKMQLIFPNEFCYYNFIKKKNIYKIPDSRYSFSFILGAPYGTEFIKVVASTVQFKDIENSFEILGTTSKEIVTRGLNVRQKKEQITEALISYTILEK